jgi:hypothetical protein
VASKETEFHAAPERPTPRQRPPSRRTRALVLVGGGSLLAYALLTAFVAAAWGPGNSDEAVSGGPELVPWFGLPITGTAAALAALWLVSTPRSAIWALLVAALSLGAWTTFVFLVA